MRFTEQTPACFPQGTYVLCKLIAPEEEGGQEMFLRLYQPEGEPEPEPQPVGAAKGGGKKK